MALNFRWSSDLTPLACVEVKFYVSRHDLVEATIYRLYNRLCDQNIFSSYDYTEEALAAVTQRIGKADIEAELRELLYDSGSPFQEFGVADRIGESQRDALHATADLLVAHHFPSLTTFTP